MGYIKKLKNNELVGGTDKTTIYPVTSTKAVFEEVTDGDKSSFKSQETINKEQQDELDDHEERIQAAEVEDIKSITINGSTKKFRVDDNNNVDLTIYTVDNDPEMPSIASNVEDLRNMVGTSTPVQGTSHKTRIETLEGGESVAGSVENKIKTKVDSINSSYQDDNNEYVKYSMTQVSGEVTDFNIDETSLKNAITSLSTSISGTNIIIVPQNQNLPSTGNAGTIYRKINAGNTYTDYMYSNGWKELATHNTSNEQAQVAYYTCAATGSGAQATKQFVSNGSLEYTPSSGGHIKILMGEANTATGTIYLQFGTNTTNNTTKKPLYYNGKPASASNTWEAGETISVYYDGTYYQASNAQGGGNAGKEELKQLVGYIPNSGDTIGTLQPSGTTWRSIKYPVSPGDVVQITGVGGVGQGFLWAIGSTVEGVEDTVIARSKAGAIGNGLVLLMPEGAECITINCNINESPAPKWYFAKAGSVGAHEMLTEAYLYNGVNTLYEGKTYAMGKSVKTIDGQLRRMIIDIAPLSLSEALVKDELKVDSNKTYRATSDITTFNPSTSYSEGAYALGNMTVYTLTVTADTVTAGNITVNGTEVSIEATDNAAAIATKISSALNIDGWTASASENVVTVRCNTIGNNTTTITIDAGDTGIVVSGNSTPSVAGTDVIMKYDGESWANATSSGMVTDGILVEVDEAWLITNATQQNSVTQDIDAATTYWEDINIASVTNSYVGMFKSNGVWRWQNGADGNYGKFIQVEPGRKYRLIAGPVEASYALLKDNTHVTGNVTNFATGETGRLLVAHGTAFFTPPADARYLYFRTNSNGGLNRTPESISIFRNFHDLKNNYDEHFETLDNFVKSNEAAIKNINDFPDVVLTGEESVDVASLEERDCSLGSNGRWYYNGRSAGKHKAIEVEPDSVVGIKISEGDYGFYGWVTSSYTPPANNAIIPYAVGTGRKELYKKDTYIYLKAPGGAKYLIICTVDGGGVMTDWEVVNCEYNYKNNNFVKFRVAHWNIGHFAGYDGVHAGYNPTITPENAEVMARRYKQVINDVGADIFGISEYDPNFTTDGQKSKDIIFQCYNKIIEGTKQEYNCNTIMFSGFKYINSGEIQYSSRQQHRYIKYANIEINGRSVCVVQTHWDFNTPELKRSQGTQLLNLVKDCKYAIVSGDLNIYDVRGTESHRESDIATLKMFRDAGFEFANNGYLDPFTTVTDGCSVDHIMVKGFSMSNRHTSEVSGTLSDHYLLYCDLVMNP